MALAARAAASEPSVSETTEAEASQDSFLEATEARPVSEPWAELPKKPLILAELTAEVKLMVSDCLRPDRTAGWREGFEA